MRLHIRLLRDGATELDETIDWSPAPELPEHPLLRKAGLRLRQTDGYHGIVDLRGRTLRLRRRNRVELDDSVELRLDLYPHPSAVPARRGACSSCGSELKTRQAGGAYRSIAREERYCEVCGCVVLGLAETTDLVGQFVDHNDASWVTVTTAFRCTDCLEPMSQGKLTTREGDATVERCTRCNLLLIEPSDASALRGEE